MKSRIIGTMVAAALMKASPIFGEKLYMIDKHAVKMQRQVNRAKKAIKYYRRALARPQLVKFTPGYQFPEFLKLEARNIESGKWAKREG